MKYIFGIVLLILIIILIKNITVQQKKSSTISYTLDNKTYALRTAMTPEEWEQGLMHVTKREGFDGMIFIFPDYQTRTFWNKNTLVDLDLYWLHDDTVVGKELLPSINKTKDVLSIFSPSEVNKVIEIIRD